MKLFKKIFFPLLFIIIYISLLITVFIGNTDIADIGTTLGLQLLLIILGLLAIQTIPLSSKKVLFGLITVFGFTRSLLALLTNNIQHAIFIACTHLIFLVYTWERFHLIHSSKSFYLWRSAHRGLGSTSILLAVTYIGTLRGTSTGLNLDCNRLHDQTIGLIKQYIPNMQNNTGLLMVVDKIDNFSTQSFGQLLGIDTTLSGTSLGENTHPIDLTTLLSGTNVSLLSGGYLSLSSGTGQLTGQSHNVGVLGSLLGYQQNLLNGIINNQELIDAQVCNVTLTHINTIAQNNDIKLIAFVLLILWLSFFMRSIMFIIGVINFILLRLLFTTGWLKKTIIQEDCEQIDV